MAEAKKPAKAEAPEKKPKRAAGQPKPGPKHGPKHGPNHSLKTPAGHEARQLQRAYEHLGRVESLERVAPAANMPARALVTLAQQQMQAGQTENAAELLRAAEHFCFAALASASEQGAIPAPLEAAAREACARLLEKAEKRGEGEWRGLQAQALAGARHALAEGGYRRALELARAAEALAHVVLAAAPQLPPGKSRLRLAAF